MSAGQAAQDLAVVTTGLTKEFGDRRVVDDLDLAIPSGSVCGFVGPNGAGKTTTIRMLLGLIRPTSGSGRILQGDLDHPASYLARVGALIESPAFYPSLSGRDNLLALVRLGQLAPSAIPQVLERVGLADRGMTIFVSSHLLSEIEHICDHVVMIRSGRSVFQGSVAELYGMRTSELAIRPEDAGQLGSLAHLLSARGLTAQIEESSGTVVVADAVEQAGSLNRAAFEA